MALDEVQEIVASIIAAAVVERVLMTVEQRACAHGMLFIPTVSTADTAPAPVVRCIACCGDVEGVRVEKVDAMLEITNNRAEPVTFVPFYGGERTVAPGAKAIYSHGRFFSDRAAADLSLSQGENQHGSQ